MYTSGFIGDSADITEAEFQQAFSDFLAKYRKSYVNSYEFENRYLIFRDNYQLISDHNLNSEHIGFTLDINEFADLRKDEFQDRYLGYKAPPMSHRINKKLEKMNSMDDFQLPSLESLLESKKTEEEPFEDFTWVGTGKVQKVKNQGSCGSCWAFSAIGAVESAYAIAHDTDALNLSEQQLVDCARPQGNQGCQGGWMDSAFEYAEESYLCTEEEYPYKGKNNDCQLTEADLTCEDKVHVADFVDVTPNSKAALRDALDKGPVSVAIDASSPFFQFYKRGVVRYLCGTTLNHGVLAVGYGHGDGLFKFLDDVDYFVIKNSWGSSWGDHGYVKIRAKDNKNGGTCGVLQQPSYPVVA
eukprot:CAMPEP_0196994808 /NCGR_PEP_ID=MMETSP1380-20130617/1039_1 /TAXON_ID=5936 /ORGANISM="Euplotes crassus, Strain CT5" /LENGTH=355 /DNA_ID=CAMNT_0042410283 /DNA_START=111 /DNA_END=1178 /DNA_ORIENTATION=-